MLATIGLVGSFSILGEQIGDHALKKVRTRNVTTPTTPAS
jgi:hypothetical protein